MAHVTVRPLSPLVLIALSLAPPAVAKSVPIASCPYIISSPGNYYLAADLGPCVGPFAIQIAADHVRLRLEGHTITGSSASLESTDGISATGVQKIKIEGPGTINSFRF